MNSKPLAIPPAISEYIRDHFKEDFLTEINSYMNSKGEINYSVDISNENTLYHLKFHSDGRLFQKDMEPINELNEDELSEED